MFLGNSCFNQGGNKRKIHQEMINLTRKGKVISVKNGDP